MTAKSAFRTVVTSATPYDILGYLLPGGAVLLCCYFFEFWLVHVDKTDTSHAILPTYSLFHALASGLSDKSWAIATIFLGIAIAAIYVVGHLVASIAAILLERHLIQHGHGYPLSRYVGYSDSPTTPVTRPFYRAVFFWFNVYVLLRYWQVVLPPRRGGSGISWIAFAADLFAWFLVGLIALKIFLSSRSITKYCEEGRYKPAGLGFLAHIISYAAIPYDLLGNLLTRSLDLHKPLSPPLQERFIRSMRERYALEPGEWGSDAYWMSCLRIRSAGRSIADLADNWLRLYSFARNLATAFYVAFLYGYLDLALNRLPSLGTADAGEVTVAIPLAFLSAAFLMLSRYYYLYAPYYTKYLVRAVVYLESRSGRRTDSSDSAASRQREC